MYRKVDKKVDPKSSDHEKFFSFLLYLYDMNFK